MPVTFVAAVVYDWTVSPALPAARPRACPKKPAPKRKAKKKCKPKKPKPHRKLPAHVRTLLVDRFEAATRDGRVELCDEDMPCESLDFTLAELAMLLRILFPEEYRDPHEGRAEPKPTATAPGSAERIAEYAFRVATRRVVNVPGDATAHGARDRGLAIVQRKNGAGPKVVGWAEGG